ncbi:hypothetical protein J6590_089710, partial [Homalodisca vitripennis]
MSVTNSSWEIKEYRRSTARRLTIDQSRKSIQERSKLMTTLAFHTDDTLAAYTENYAHTTTLCSLIRHRSTPSRKVQGLCSL